MRDGFIQPQILTLKPVNMSLPFLTVLKKVRKFDIFSHPGQENQAY
jgi:hypothetical protein